MAVTEDPAAGSPTVDLREPSGWRRTKNQITTTLMWVSFVVVLIPLGFVGTIGITAFAALWAIPLGVLGAVYINEYGGNRWLAGLINFLADVMTGVPSIVMGLFIFTILVLQFGYSGMAGSFALACLMLPVVIRSSCEMLR